ncbi:MAG: hypothetical protein H6534_10075 [Chthonomonadaceae bacterium]|nr:hypothetical protein [Chthonomonadaceae bacterium]
MTLALFAAVIALGSGSPAPLVQNGLVTDSIAAKARLQKFMQHQALEAATPYKQPWMELGPWIGTGRIVDVQGHPDRPGLIVAAAASGGLFKSTDDGKSWDAIFQNEATACMGDLALAPSNPDILWVGTGEANILRSTMAGTGAYKSVDGGKSFQHMGLTDTQHVSRIRIHPTNPDIVYVASAGHEYEFTPDRGVYKTTDGGKTWRKVFYKNEKTAVIDLAMDPKDPETLYAATAQRLRTRWNDPVASPESGIYKTTDGGKTWKPLTEGLPDFAKGECERIGLDICDSQPNVVVAVIFRNGAEVFRSEDKGETWKAVEGGAAVKNVFPEYSWYFGQIRVDPNDPLTMDVFGLRFARTTDGGKTWKNVRGNHSDYHAEWINPKDSKNVLVGNDGGLMVSHDGLDSYEHANNMPIAQFYNVSISQAEGTFHAYSSRQDFGGWRGEIVVNPDRTLEGKSWAPGPGDESGRHAVDPTNPDLVYYVTRYGGGPSLADYSQKNPRNGNPPLNKSLSPDFGTDRKRAQWVSPIIVSPADPNRVLFGAQFVFVSDDQGATWRKISPDLTNLDEAKQGNIAYSTVFAIAESPLKKGVIYAGTDDGNVQVTRDEGATWTKANAGLPEGLHIATLEASRFDEGTVYVGVNGKRSDDFGTYLFKSTDYGKTWTSIAGNIPGGSVNVVKEDPTNKQILYVGTDMGVYVTVDGGRRWTVLGKGLPTVYAHDLAIRSDGFLILATHGRGLWGIDLTGVRAR